MTLEKAEAGEAQALKVWAEKEFEQYEAQHGVAYRMKPFAFAAKEKGEILGVVRGFTCFSEAYIDDLAVGAQYRAKGIGRQLMQAAEVYCRACGVENMNLCTYGFQAPGFYEKLGFTLEFIRKNRQTARLDKYYYVKYFGAEETAVFVDAAKRNEIV